MFYRPPSSNANYFSHIEDSIALAVDTGIIDIVISGDFNLNMLNQNTSRKIGSVCETYNLNQIITKPTHFTEHSSSLIDLIIVSNKDHVLLSGVGEPFPPQHIRYHCPIYGIFKFSKPKTLSFKRHIWYYERGDYNSLRNKASDINWELLHNDDIDIHANNIHNAIISIARVRIHTH